MCNGMFADDRLGLGPNDESLDFHDAEDKQWFIECKTLELEQIKALTEQLNAQARLIEAQNQALQSKPTTVEQVIECDVDFSATCGYCGSQFNYQGDDNDTCDTLYSRFCDVHDPCGRR